VFALEPEQAGVSDAAWLWKISLCAAAARRREQAQRPHSTDVHAGHATEQTAPQRWRHRIRSREEEGPLEGAEPTHGSSGRDRRPATAKSPHARAMEESSAAVRRPTGNRPCATILAATGGSAMQHRSSAPPLVPPRLRAAEARSRMIETLQELRSCWWNRTVRGIPDKPSRRGARPESSSRPEG